MLRSFGLNFEDRNSPIAGDNIKKHHMRGRKILYNENMGQAIKELLERVSSWPDEDQEELVEVVRDIQARRAGIYRATREELKVLDEADRSGISSEEDVKVAFRSFHRE